MLNIFEHALGYFIIHNFYKLSITFKQVDVYLNEPIKVDKLIKLVNQSNYQGKDTLGIEALKITTVIVPERKQNKLVIRSVDINDQGKND